MTNRCLRMQHTASEIVVLEPRKMNPKYVSLPVKDDDQFHRAHPVKVNQIDLQRDRNPHGTDRNGETTSSRSR
jgi:hypothetical protein